MALDPPSLALIVAQRRRDLGLTQEELAARVVAAGDPAFRQSDVSRLERGRVTLPRRDRLERIAAVLELPIGELLAGSGWAGAAEALARTEPDAIASPPLIPGNGNGVGEGVYRQPPAAPSKLLRDRIAEAHALEVRTAEVLRRSAAVLARADAAFAPFRGDGAAAPDDRGRSGSSLPDPRTGGVHDASREGTAPR